MPDGVGVGGCPAHFNTSNFPIDLNSSDFSAWIASQECTDSLARALQMADDKIIEYITKKQDLQKALKERGAKKEHNEEEEQVATKVDSPKYSVGENIQSIIRDIEQGKVDAIQLRNKRITPGEAIALAEAMEKVANAKKSTIKTLHLYGNKIGDEGVVALSDVIANENSAVEDLDLGACGMTDVGALALAKALKKNKTVRQIVLKYARITSQGVGAIAQVLGNDSCIERLLLGSCELDCEGATLLAKALSKNSALKHLECEHNKGMGQGLVEIAKALKENKSLERLNLGFCDVNDDVVNEIASALREKETALQNITLRGNNITDDGAERLVRALKESDNQKVDSIYLDSNRVSCSSDARVKL